MTTGKTTREETSEDETTVAEATTEEVILPRVTQEWLNEYHRDANFATTIWNDVCGQTLSTPPSLDAVHAAANEAEIQWELVRDAQGKTLGRIFSKVTPEQRYTLLDSCVALSDEEIPLVLAALVYGQLSPKG